jgi:hypothetical protein
MTNLMRTKEDYWYAHLRFWNNQQLFPREYGLKRTEVYKNEYFFLLSTQYNKMSCYTSVYSEGQIKKNIYDTLFLEVREVDQGVKVNMEDVIMDRDMLCGIFNKHKIGYRCFYSGGRSYRFYTDFPPIPVVNLYAMARNFVDDLDIADLLDMHTVGNRRSVDRIPYTYNPKHGKYAVYSMADDGHVLEEDARKGRMTIPPVRELQETEILKYLKADDADYTIELMKPSEIAFDGVYPDCVLNIMSKLRLQHHANHEERIHLAAYMYKLGHPLMDIVNAFRDASDFNPIVAEQQVLSVIGNNYNPYGCTRVKMNMDICPYNKRKAYCNYIQKLVANKKVALEVN